jgi:ParB-like nuclease domain
VGYGVSFDAHAAGSPAISGPAMKTYHYRGEATLVPIERIHPSKMIGRKDPKQPRLEGAREELASGDAIEPIALFRHDGEYLLADGMHRYMAALEAALTHLPCAFWESAWSINRGEWI